MHLALHILIETMQTLKGIIRRVWMEELKGLKRIKEASFR
jgi:hypothetical protein